MLSEREVQILYDSARGVVAAASAEVTIDRHVAEAEEHAKAYARVLGIPYDPPKRRR